MERINGSRKAIKLAAEDVITSMPEIVLSNILDRLPINEAVGTSILSRNWRFKWTMLTEIVFDYVLTEYERTISRLLLPLKGPVTKFVLHVPNNKVLEDEYVNHWVMFLSRNGIKEFTLLNFHQTPLKLPTHLFSCLELKHLNLHNCSFHPAPTFYGFPNLLSLELFHVTFESRNFGETITQCPLLEILKISYYDPIGKVRLVELATLKNLMLLSLSLCKLDNIPITSSIIFQLGGYLPKLQELTLDFQYCKFLGEPGARKWVSTAFPCLETLTLLPIGFSSKSMLSYAFEMIWGCPNLRTLKITAARYHIIPPPTFSCSEIDNNTMGKLQLRTTLFESFRGSDNEIYLIKSLLAYSPLLKNIAIHVNSSRMFGGDDGKLMFASKLLTLHRASPIAEVKLY